MIVLLIPLLYLLVFAWSAVSLANSLRKRNLRGAQVFAPLAFFALIGLLNSAAAQEIALALAGAAR